MLRRLRKLAAQPAFRAEPFAVLARAGVWSAAVTAHRFGGPNPAFRLTRAGERLRVPPDFRYTSITAFLLRDWVEPELRELDQLLKPGQTFVDVGANIGLFTLKAARLVGPTGKVIAVEPGAVAYGQLVSNVALNTYTHVTNLEAALSDEDGFAELHHVPLGDDPQAFSLISNARASTGEMVKTIRLDTLVKDMALTRIDLIKIDVEGAEPMVLAGATDVLKQLKPAVIFECNAHLNAGGEGDAAAKAWMMLAEVGYGFHRLVGRRFEAINTPPSDFCNVLAVHRDAVPPFA